LPGARSGEVRIPASKSCAHRALIAAALYGGSHVIVCDGISKDIQATIRCLKALGAEITVKGEEIFLKAVSGRAEKAELFPGESGSTMRFLLPVAGAMGAEAVFRMEGRLSERPMEPLVSELERGGMEIRQEGKDLYCRGRLQAGEYTLPGNVSSQFVSGMMFALPMCGRESQIRVTGEIESADYIAMTVEALKKFGARWERKENVWTFSGIMKNEATERIEIESDWSSAAFFLAMGALSPGGIRVKGMNLASGQGDKRIVDVLGAFGCRMMICEDEITVSGRELRGQEIDASLIPDLVPAISAVAALAGGKSVICHAERLRLKESDRIESTAGMLRALGVEVSETADGLIIRGKKRLRGGEVDPKGDHRIAMAAAVAACGCEEKVIVNEAECTEKSFPAFWEKMEGLMR